MLNTLLAIGARNARELERTRFDVLDDLEAEARDVAQSGNAFVNCTFQNMSSTGPSLRLRIVTRMPCVVDIAVVDCLPVHIARMAGCNSAIADELDELPLPPYSVATLCTQVLGLAGSGMPHFTDVSCV